MVLRNRKWHRTALAAACMVAASSVGPAAANDLAPMDGGMPGLGHAGQDRLSAPTPQGNLVWGGPVPPMPGPGQDTVYIPSGSIAAPPPQRSAPAYEPLPPQGAVQAERLAPPPGDPDAEFAALDDELPSLPSAVPAGRGVPEGGTPTGYAVLPAQETQCRRELARLGARFSEAGNVGSSKSCGIPYALTVQVAVRGIAMQPAATMNCRTALKVARWLDDDVRSAARWRLWKNPTAVINASSYRCSRIAGSHTVSEHASGNALDVGGFRFSDGSTVRVEPKGIFRFRERGFQNSVRQAGCRHFGTVLGPGYNKAHDDHFHLDGKSRRRTVCK